jgi:hypothetical protein
MAYTRGPKEQAQYDLRQAEQQRKKATPAALRAEIEATKTKVANKKPKPKKKGARK